MNDDDLIQIVMSVRYATCIASLMQMALRHPHIKREVPTLYADGRKIFDDLVRAIADRTPDSPVLEMFDRGWHDRHDVTADEFDRMMEDSLDADEN